MPANLTPEFLKARERFRQAKTPEERLSALEEMLATIPKHKGTDKMQADIKRRIAKLRDVQTAAKKSRRSRYDHISKEGAGQCVLVGPPNSGKSTLLASLTNAKPEIAEYPFSTVIPIPGMMRYADVWIQLVDLPPVTLQYTEGWVYSLIREADLVLLVLDPTDPSLLHESLEEILFLLEERHIELVEERGEGDEGFKEIPALIVLTRGDLGGGADFDLPFPSVLTGPPGGIGLDRLREAVFRALRIIRIYTKLPGKKPDLTEPYTLPIGSTVIDAVRAVHRDFTERLKYVRIWGSGRFDGQQVPADHVLEDGDIIEIHTV